MGKRVNLAELANEDVPDDYSPSRRDAAISTTGGLWAAAAAQDGPPLDAGRLPVADIATNPLNRRADADLWGEEFDQLVHTIREHGVLQPIVVCSAEAFLIHYPDQRVSVERFRWVALIGNRRLLAARGADCSEVPVLVSDDRIATMYEVMLVENSHRRDLGPMHEAEAMQQVLGDSGISQRELATRIGRTHVYVFQRLALLGLIPALRDAFDDGRLKLEQARQLGGLPEVEQEAIAAAGPPYRRRRSGSGGNAVNTRRRTIKASTPEKAAESIRAVFTADELSELIALLSTKPEP